MSAAAAIAVTVCALAALIATFAGSLWSAYQKGWEAGQDDASRRWAEDERNEAIEALKRERKASDDLREAQERLRSVSSDLAGVSTDELLGRVFVPVRRGEGPGGDGGGPPQDPPSPGAIDDRRPEASA